MAMDGPRPPTNAAETPVVWMLMAKAAVADTSHARDGRISASRLAPAPKSLHAARRGDKAYNQIFVNCGKAVLGLRGRRRGPSKHAAN
jgi:hypothetical protein